MSKKLQIVDSKFGLNFNVRYDPMKAEKSKIIRKTPDGKLATCVMETGYYAVDATGVPDMSQKWSDSELSHFEDVNGTLEERKKTEITKIFDISSYEPNNVFTDEYIVDKYYKIFPSDNDEKKDYNKERAIQINRIGLRKLWEYLMEHKVVARSYFNTSAGGYVDSVGLIRALPINGTKWALEIGQCKDRKEFHVDEHFDIKTAESVLTTVSTSPTAKGAKTIRRI